MKKLAAILFLLLFLFNLVGYQWMFNYAQQQADSQLETSLDQQLYNEADLISIKVPLSMPYQTLQSGFERVDGEITVKGKIYKYVKRRIVNGELELLCLPHQNKMRLQQAKIDYFKTTADINADRQESKKDNSSKTSLFKSIVADYEQQAAAYTLAGMAIFKVSYFISNTFLPNSLPHTPPGQPPDVHS